MDRYYLGKLVDDINLASGKLLEQILGSHLRFFLALDERVDVGERHLKYLRYLYAIDDQCPAARVLDLHEAMAVFCRRFSPSDVTCSFHFGYDNHVPVDTTDLSIILQFYLLDHQQDHSLNMVLAAGLMDEPERQLTRLPSWMNPGQVILRERLEEEVLGFCQHYISRDFEHLYQIRDFEAAFWRVVNLACGYFDKPTYEDLVALLSARFQPQLRELPAQWHTLRKQERHFSQEAFVVCSRNSFRFCQHLMDGED